MLSNSSSTYSPKSPKISLLVAAYNIENYIEKCLNSLVQQTLKDIEIIVVNDGSTDTTLDKIKDFANKDERIKIIDQENQGLSNVRKVGFQVAQGKYIQYVDGDDWLVLNACEKLYNQAEKELADVVVFHYQKVYSNGEKQNCCGYHKERLASHTFISFVKGGLFCSVCTKLIRRQFLVDCDFQFPQNITYGEDEAFSALLFLQQPNIAFINDYLYCYYQRTESANHDLESYVNDSELVFSLIKQALNMMSAEQIIIEYADFYTLIYLLILYAKAIVNEDKQITKKIHQKILKKNIVVAKSIYNETPTQQIKWQLYNRFPKLYLIIKKLHLKLQ